VAEAAAPATVKLLALGAEISEEEYKKVRTQYEETKVANLEEIK
jgi:hypothetical protein